MSIHHWLSAVVVVGCAVLARPGRAESGCAAVLRKGSIFTWESFLDGKSAYKGKLEITKLKGDYVEAQSTTVNDSKGHAMYGTIDGERVGLTNPGGEEAWMGVCAAGRVAGHVNKFTFTYTP